MANVMFQRHNALFIRPCKTFAVVQVVLVRPREGLKPLHIHLAVLQFKVFPVGDRINSILFLTKSVCHQCKNVLKKGAQRKSEKIVSLAAANEISTDALVIAV